MPAIDEPFNIQNGQNGDADAVMANFATIVNAINGGLDMGANVKAAAPTASILGSVSSAGTSVSGLRSDAQFTIQGFENSSADPATGNFVGRTYYNTVNNQTRLCIATTGSGTWVSMGNPLASELVVHAAQHKPGGHDPLAANTVDETMFAAKTNIFSATLGSDHTDLSASSWADIIDLAVTTTGVQTLGIAMSLRYETSGGGGNPLAQFRLVDVTASNTTLWTSQAIECPAGVQTESIGYFFYSAPLTGARTLRVQACASSHTSGGITVKKHTFVQTETVAGPTIQAVIL